MMDSLHDFVDYSRFNKIFMLPADLLTGRTKPFKLQYADYGYRNEDQPAEETVFLFFGPMLGSRLAHIAKDEPAKQRKIRIINPDRPGMGGTDVANQEDLMSLWRVVILALLKHLNIKHVCIGCHSGGTIYALDMLLHHPEILHPDKDGYGYLAIGAPWILPSHTGSTVMSMVKSLPTSVISKTDKLAKMINNHVGPMAGFSAGVIYGLLARLNPGSSLRNDEVAGDHSVDSRFEAELWPEVIKRIYAASVEGISSDAILFLQKGSHSHAGWGRWGDYDKLVLLLKQALHDSGKTLRVDVFYAEKDFLIGDAGSKGSKWFDQCWQTGLEHVTIYTSTTIAGADHDTIWSLRWGAVQTVFGKVSRLAV